MKKPLLIDLDGVLRLGRNPAPGLDNFFDYIKSSDRKCAIISNTTLSTAATVYKYFYDFDLPVPCLMMTAADATAFYIKTNYKRAAVYSTPEVKRLFEEVLDYDNPEVVVMGDLGKEWDFNSLNNIFKLVQNGAELIAMQKNKFWSTPEDGLLLDLGAFVAAIEYSTGKSATLIGKPSPLYFYSALDKLNAPRFNFLMLGDDLENDIMGAQNIGGSGILILSGKTKPPLKFEDGKTPDYIVENLDETIEILENLD